MNKTITFLLIFFFSTNCSLNNTTGFWSKSEKLKTENTLIEKEIFQESKIYEKEFNTNLKIKLKNNFKNKSFINNLSNNNGVVNFKGSLKKVSKYKFSKITQFDYFQPELLLTNRNSVIFFENKGSIFNFNENSKLIWKKNIYSKSEKKLKPILYFTSNEKYLIVADNIAKYYAININNGELIWYKNNTSPFNSQVKIFKDKFNIDVESFSYPYGKYNKNIIQFVKKYYRYAVTTKRSRFRFNKFDLLEIPRIPVNSDTSIFKFYLKIKTFYEDIKYIN